MSVIVRRFAFERLRDHGGGGRLRQARRQRLRGGFMQLIAPPLAAPMRSFGVPAGFRTHRIGARSAPVGERVKISHPVSVTPTVCSNCADSDRSRVTAVQPSERIFTP